MLTSLTVCVLQEAVSGTDVSFQRWRRDASPPVTTRTGRRHLSGDVASRLLSMWCEVPQLVKAQADCADRAGGLEGLSLYIGD